jgi:hypothetical protein
MGGGFGKPLEESKLIRNMSKVTQLTYFSIEYFNRGYVCLKKNYQEI